MSPQIEQNVMRIHHAFTSIIHFAHHHFWSLACIVVAVATQVGWFHEISKYAIEAVTFFVFALQAFNNVQTAFKNNKKWALKLQSKAVWFIKAAQKLPQNIKFIKRIFFVVALLFTVLLACATRGCH